jgi:hypothetical protein
LALHKESEKLEEHLMRNHVHMQSPPLGGSWFYDRFERFTIQASGFSGS